jgi:hypothetical protein
MRKLHKLIPAIAATLAASQAYGFVFYEGFDYPAGTLAEVTAATPNNLYTGRTNPFGPTWYVAGASTTDTIAVTAPTLSGPAWLGGSGNSAEWAGPASGSNAARIEIGPFSGPSAGGFQQTLYYSLALNVTDISALNPGTSAVGNILAGFNTVSGPQTGVPSVIGTRVLARQHPSDATKFQIGMTKNNSTGTQVLWDPAMLDVNTTQFIVGSYTLIGTGADANDVSKLWLNPASTSFGALEGSVPTASIENAQGGDMTTNRIESFLFRQSGPAGTGATNTGIRVDEVRVDTTWAGVAPAEPNAWTGGNGAWSDTTKWSTATVPDSVGKFIQFGPSAAATTVTLDGSRTSGTVHFNSPNAYTVAGSGLTLDGSSSIVVHNGDHAITAPLTAAGNLTVTVATGKSLTIGHLTMAPAATLLKSGAGSATVDHVRANRLAVLGGTLAMAADSGANGVSVVNTLELPILTDVARPAGFTFDVGPRGKVDLKNNKLIIQSGTVGTTSNFIYNGIQGLVQHSYNFQSWDQSGLTTSMADAKTGLTTIGVSTGAARGGLGPTDTDLFAGQTITGASVIAMYTYAGDANLDGVIDGGDYGVIDNNVQIVGADGYFNGDFNYDGVIDGGDYGVIDNNIQAQGAPIPVSGSVGVSGVTAVPEPTACGFATLVAGVSLLTRRRRNA